MKKFNFNSKSALSTAAGYAVGGAANAGMDYAVENVEFLKSLSPMWLGLTKIAVGVVGRSLSKQQFVQQAADGVGIAGAGELIKGVMDGTISFGGDSNEGSNGLPQGTIGRLRPGNRRFMTRGSKVSGLSGSMGM